MLNWLSEALGREALRDLELLLDEWSAILFLGFLAVELARYAVVRRFDLRLVGDTVVNFVTQIFFIAIAYVALGVLFVSGYFALSKIAIFQIDTTWLTVIACIALADFAYYWEHRFNHRVNMAWATHSVHHSSGQFNISVALRFGPLDWLWPIFFHAPMILAGFDPVLVLFAEFIVLLYQTPLHTEMIGKLPRWVEAVMNTPSHHRVHHGSNHQYLDRNYAGIFIVWDRIFGTFAEEGEPVTYGLVKPLTSLNPVVVLFHGIVRLARKIATAPGFGAGLTYLVAPPDWEAPKQ